jgi:serine/threonine-protein kinase
VSGEVDPKDPEEGGDTAAGVPPTLRRPGQSTVGLERGTSPEADLRLLVAGEQLAGRFTILRFVARGGMGAVYEASDVILRSRVALKVLEGRITADPAAMERFRREVLLARRVSHPNVCRVYELYEATTAAGTPVSFLTMEFLDGETLASRLSREGRFTSAQALPLVQQMCEGLAAAHAEGVVHRDFKSSNVLLVPRAGESGTGSIRVVITDFGVARALEQHRGAEALTGGAGILGTPEYMAPEQVTGGEISPATDVYALGVVLYQMVTGALPFTGDTPLATAARRIDTAPPRPDVAAPGLDPRWSRAILRCLDRDPRHRFQHAPDVGAALASGPSRARWPLVVGGVAVLTVALVLGIRLGWAPTPAQPSAQALQPSIAVLPFVDMSPGHDQEYFSDGVAQEILNALAQVPELRVVARSSSFAFKGRNEDLRTVGQKLQVANVLEGSVQKSGDRLRVTAQLVNAADGYQLWSQTFDRNLADVFAVQDEIARAVVGALRVRVLPKESRTPEVQVTKPEVYAAYLRGLKVLNSGSFAEFPKAIEYFRKATALDPDYAPAHAALAYTMMTMGANADSTTVNGLDFDWRRDGSAEAEKAVALNPRLADGYAARGTTAAFVTWDWQAALRDYEQAIALAPGNTTYLSGYADVLSLLGRSSEALAAAQKAAALDPLSAGSSFELGNLYVRLGQYVAARAVLENAIALNPDHLHRRYLGYLDLLEGHPDKALALFRSLPQEWTRDFGIALAEHTMGNEDASQRALNDLIRTNAREAPYQIANVYAWRGDRDHAFEWLERAYHDRDPGLPFIKIDVFSQSLHGDPRFAALLAKLKLPTD